MSDESKGIVLLFRNIQDALSKGPIDELNQALIQYVNKKDGKSEEVDYVMQLIADEFGYSKKTLRKTHARGPLQDAKQTAYCLLHFVLGLSTRHIAKRIFFNWHTSVANGIRRYKLADPKHKADIEFIVRYEKLKVKLIAHITGKSEVE